MFYGGASGAACQFPATSRGPERSERPRGSADLKNRPGGFVAPGGCVRAADIYIKTLTKLSDDRSYGSEPR